MNGWPFARGRPGTAKSASVTAANTSFFTDLPPHSPLDRTRLADHGWPCHERTPPFWDCRFARSTAASGKRFARVWSLLRPQARDEDTGELHPTNVACKLLDRRDARCTDYGNRKRLVPDCVKLTRRAGGARVATRNLRIPIARRRKPVACVALSDLGKRAKRCTKRDNRPAAGRSARTKRGSLSGMWSNGRSEALLQAALPVPLTIKPVRSAKRLRLRYDELRGTLTLTCRRARAGGQPLHGC